MISKSMFPGDWGEACRFAANLLGHQGFAWIECLDSCASQDSGRLIWVLKKETDLSDDAFPVPGIPILAVDIFLRLPPENFRIFPGYDVIYFLPDEPKELTPPRFRLWAAANHLTEEDLARHSEMFVNPSEVDSWMSKNGVVGALASGEFSLLVWQTAKILENESLPRIEWEPWVE